MNRPFHFNILWSLTLLLLTSIATLVSGQDSKCGSLITYRQHSVLLSEAPQCFRSGCISTNSSEPASTISSPCPVQAPCNTLWEILKQKFELDWCDSCGNDIACRIDGWPI